MQPRPYQRDALQISKEKWDAGTRRQLIVLPTGTGKTVVFANLPEHHKFDKQMMVLIHREELADQARDKIKKWNPTLNVGVEMGSERCDPSNDDVVVASVPTIGRQNSPRLTQFSIEHLSGLVTDEAHHSVAGSYQTIFNHFRLLEDEPGLDQLLLGVTATPKRGDGQALGQIYDEIVYQMSIEDAITQGWLADIVCFTIPTNITLDNVHTHAGDFAVGELEQAVNVDSRNHLIAQSWLKYAEGRQTVAFTVDIAHAKALAETFKLYGVAAEAIWGSDPHRADKLDAHRRGHLRVLTNCGVLTEGYDDWRIRCIIMARPTKSQLLFVQMAGRGTRIQDNINNLVEAIQRGYPSIEKKDCLLMDVVDNTERHSLVTLATIFGLPAKMDMGKKAITDVLEKMEKARFEFPQVDLNKLTSIDELEDYIQKVNLFETKWPEEVEQNSVLQWRKTADNDYVLLLPKGERVEICSNLLGHWQVDGQVKGNKFHVENAGSLPDAFKQAEEFVTMFGRDLLTLLRRKAKWHSAPITPPQKSMVRRLYRYRPEILKHLDTMTKGDATTLISQFYANARKPATGGTRLP